MCKRLSRCMPEPVIAAAAENGKKKRPAHIRLAGGRAEAHAENGKKRGWLTFDWLADVPKLTLRTVKKKKEAGSN